MPPRSEPGPRVQRFIAEARALCESARCPKCDNRSLNFDFDYESEPYSLRFYERCGSNRCSYTGEF